MVKNMIKDILYEEYPHYSRRRKKNKQFPWDRITLFHSKL